MSDPKKFGDHKGAGAVILTGSGRFFSNGLDYPSATKNRRFFEGESGYFILPLLFRRAGMALGG
jgi:enoyl-CoA hydratase/carnithine racemase